ncbi:cytochrome P450 [Trametes polyzona]|nr:cytochrome P450 [Trametes polyzona]
MDVVWSQLASLAGELPRGVLGLALSAALVYVVTRAILGQRRNLPPGPRGLPLIGNVHQLPISGPEKALYKWRKRYGDVVYFRIFRTPAIALGSIEAARELLDKRSAIYSDRPRLVLLTEELGVGSALPTMPYGEQFRRHRKWLADAVGNKDTQREHHDVQRREVRRLLRNLYNDPDRFVDHLHLYLAAMMLEITYGRRVTSLDDELLRVADRGMSSMDEAGKTGTLPVNIYSILRYIPNWVPGAGDIKRYVNEVRENARAWLNSGYDVVTSAASGTAAPCIFTSVLEEYGNAPTLEEAEDIKGLGISVYGAGVETSRGILSMFFWHMVRSRHVLLKAQEEIDKVVGSSRLPDFSDRESLPYVDALLEEIHRWNPSFPMGLPHSTSTDDHYHGYYIPARCMVIPNTWAMSRDTRYYPNPEVFRPERHLEPPAHPEGHLLPSEFVFGFGRRVCPGQAFADASIWLAIVNILALFDIRKAVDENGSEITPSDEFISGFTSQPAPFVCQIVPRSEEAIMTLAHLDVSE